MCGRNFMKRHLNADGVIKMKKSLFLLFLTLFSGAVFAQSAPTQGVLDSLLKHFTDAAVSQITVSQGFAKQIFVTLVGFDLCLFAIRKLPSAGDIPDLLGGLTNKLFSWGFFYTLIVMGPQWIPLIIKSFMEMGTKIAGGNVLITPSGVMDLAFASTTAIWNAYTSASSGLSIGNDIVLGLAVVVAILMTIIAFGLITIELLATQIELAMVGSVSFFQLGMSGAGFTMQFAEKYFGFIVSTGIKLVIICAMAGFGTVMSQGFVTLVSSAPSGSVSPINMLLAAAPMFIYGVLSMRLPAMAGAVMSGAPSLSAGGLAGGAAAIAGGVAGAAMAGAGLAAGAAGMAGGAADFAKQSLDRLSAFTGSGAGAGSTGGDNFDRLASLGSKMGDSIGNPSPSNINASSETSKPSTFKEGLNKMSDAQSKMASQEGGGAGVSIRFNHLGE